MHDLVHDLARLVMVHGILDGSKQAGANPRFGERVFRILKVKKLITIPVCCNRRERKITCMVLV
jgi:hypothetical protein